MLVAFSKILVDGSDDFAAISLKFMTLINLEVFRYLPTIKTPMFKKSGYPKKLSSLFAACKLDLKLHFQTKIRILVSCTPICYLPHTVFNFHIRSLSCQTVWICVITHFSKLTGIAALLIVGCITFTLTLNILVGCQQLSKNCYFHTFSYQRYHFLIPAHEEADKMLI